MSDQAEALRGLVESRPPALLCDSAGPEIWAMTSGTAGTGLSTLADNMAAVLAGLDCRVRVWDYRRSKFTDDQRELTAGEIVLALLADHAGSASIWHAARHALLVAQAQPRSVMAAYARLEQFGSPQRCAQVKLVFNNVVQAGQAARLHFNFDSSTRKFMQTRTVLTGMVPRFAGDAFAANRVKRFPADSAAALAVRLLVNNLLQQNIRTDTVSGTALVMCDSQINEFLRSGSRQGFRELGATSECGAGNA